MLTAGLLDRRRPRHLNGVRARLALQHLDAGVLRGAIDAELVIFTTLRNRCKI